MEYYFTIEIFISEGDGVEDKRVLVHRALIRAHGKLGKILKRHLEQYNLSGAEYGIIRSLGDDSLTLSEISQRLLKVNSNTTAMIDNLEKKDWVERVRDQQDRRVIRVRLTAAGRDLRDRVLPEQNQHICQTLATLSDAESETLLVLLDKIEQICDYPMINE